MWWDWHHCDGFWPCDFSTWPWCSSCCHPLRHKRYCRTLGTIFDLDDFCSSTHSFSPHWHSTTHWKSNTLLTCPTEVTPWCHRSCLTGNVCIKTGDESDSLGKGTFKVVLDVRHFRPDELTLKVRNQDTILLQGRQTDDRANNKKSACIAREFTRRYRLPRYYDATQATASLSTDGVLTIVVPAPPTLDDVERLVEIQQTGVYYGSSRKALPQNAEDTTDKKKETEKNDDGEKERN